MSPSVEYVTAPSAADVVSDKSRAFIESLQHDWTGGGFPLSANPTVLTNFVAAKSGAGLLFGFSIYNSAAFAQNVQFHDVTNIAALTSGSSVPWINWPIQAKQTIIVQWTSPWRACKRGMIFANSTTDTVWTQGANNCLFDVQYA